MINSPEDHVVVLEATARHRNPRCGVYEFEQVWILSLTDDGMRIKAIEQWMDSAAAEKIQAFIAREERKGARNLSSFPNRKVRNSCSDPSILCAYRSLELVMV